MKPTTPLAPLHFSFAALHRQLEALGRWCLEQTDPDPVLQQARLELDTQQVALWDLLGPDLADDTRRMPTLGLVQLQLGLRACGLQLAEQGQLIRRGKLLKSLRKRLPAFFAPLQHLLRRLEEGVEQSLPPEELNEALQALAPPLQGLHRLLDKRFKSGQNAPFILRQYQWLWQLEALDGPLTQAIEGLMTWQLGSPQRLEAAILLKPLSNQVKGELHFEPIPHTRSGALVHEVADGEQNIIVKQGTAEKLAQEHKRLQQWASRWPDRVPEVLAFERNRKQAVMALASAPGETLEHWLLVDDEAALYSGLNALFSALDEMWQPGTKRADPPRFMAQLRRRLPDIYRVHPEFKKGLQGIGEASVPTLEKLIERCERLEKKLAPVLAVPIHGDLNIDNVLYDPDSDTLTLIDLNRATQGDYIQDLAILMASFYRTPNYQRTVRRRIVNAMSRVHRFAHRVGPRLEDPAIDARLALGLARGLITSTRFVYEPWHAQRLLELGQVLLASMARLKPKELPRYTLDEALFHEHP